VAGGHAGTLASTPPGVKPTGYNAAVPDVLVLYYSRHGSVAALAQQVARGINAVTGVQARVRTVPPVSAETGPRLPPVPDSGPPYATLADLGECAGLVLGSPTRFGNMAAPLKHFLDQTGGEWLAGALRGKPAGVFTASSSSHGGQESTLLTMALPLLHHGMVFVGIPYDEPAVATTRGGGSPYGAGHLAPAQGDTEPTADEAAIARRLGRRVAALALRLDGFERP
jgi:NAD(P)H dehydrogenase (quinone)